MFYRPPLLEEPGAQTLSGKITVHYNLGQEWAVVFFKNNFLLFPRYLQQLGDGSCRLKGLCSILEIEPLISDVFAAFWCLNC